MRRLRFLEQVVFESIVLLLCVYALWPLYVFTMAMLRAKEANLTTLTAWVFAFPLIVIALILDVFLNFTVFAVLTWDFPKKGEWTFSQRLNRLVLSDNWRGSVARWVAASLLDPYDPSGKHIK